ncbi:MAG: phosphodiester glycosidase family protein, partial [Verrucomicrobiales bacterium]|nr:phosphodiester glycosidase family protein [Verrucomicrobiales bacterium]
MNSLLPRHALLRGLALVWIQAVAVLDVGATMSLGPWTPLFKGVEIAKGTNTSGGGFPNLHVAHIVRVDLHDPGVRLFSSPRIDEYVAGARETGGYTVSDFLAKHRLQVAVNAGLFDPAEYYLPAGTAMDIHGLSICEGVVVSDQTSPSEAATAAFSIDKVPTVIHTNWPASSTAGIHTAVTGAYPLLYRGTNLGYELRSADGFIHRVNPRTALGVSEDKRHLFLIVIDGRQPGYSNGAFDYETAAWLLLVGAHDAINLDGGGSSTLVVEDSLGRPSRLNKSSAVADSGRERTVGNHFGIYAEPVPGFINDVDVRPDDTTALITWTTSAPATSRVRYGTTLETTQSTPLDDTPATEHAVALTGLKAGVAYYFVVESSDGTTEHASEVRTFTTTNPALERTLVEVTGVWRFTTDDVAAAGWTAPSYDDGGWEGEGPGLLWIDSRGNPRAGVSPANTALPANAGSGGFPYPTYFFRTRFDVPDDPAGVALVFTNYLDDGAVFYLNGTEIRRFRMEEAPATIEYDALATSFG